MIEISRSHSPEFYPPASPSISNSTTPVPIPSFLSSSLTPHLLNARGLHTATLIGNQWIFIAGGGPVAFTGITELHERYDIVNGSFQSVSPSTTDEIRLLQTASLVSNSNVLLFGGSNNAFMDGISDQIDHYDQNTTHVQSQFAGATRIGHTATFVETAGIIRIIGGLYKAATNDYQWTNNLLDINATTLTVQVTPSLSLMQRYFHTATLGNWTDPPNPDPSHLSILVTGGIHDGNSFVSETQYCPITPNPCASPFTNLNTARALASATLLPNGKVLIAGGVVDDVSNQFLDVTNDHGSIVPSFIHATRTAELFDPHSQSFTDTTGLMNVARAWHTATLLPNGKVLIAGGHDNTSGGELAAQTAELYDPATDTFSFTTNSMNAGRFGHTATLLPNGDVILIGGLDAGNTALNSTEIFH